MSWRRQRSMTIWASFGEEDLAVEPFVAELAVEALALAVLPRATGFDIRGPGTQSGDPVPEGLRDELRAVVGADVLRHAARHEPIAKSLDDVGRP